MKPHIKLDINVGTFRELTVPQFESLQKLMQDDSWETVDEPLRISGGGDYIGVYLPHLFLGIEKDGYAHS